MASLQPCATCQKQTPHVPTGPLKRVERRIVQPIRCTICSAHTERRAENKRASKRGAAVSIVRVDISSEPPPTVKMVKNGLD